MKNLLFPSFLCVAVILAPLRAASSAEDDLSGFTLKQLDEAIRDGNAATHKIYSILTFDSEERSGANIAMLSSSNSGWHVTVIHRVIGGLKVEWRTGRLPEDFAVSSSHNLHIEDVEDEQVVEFSGCAPHECGGLYGVLGVLLYSPRSKQAFYAHYRSDEGKPIGSFGSMEFSENASDPSNERYKAALRKAIGKILHYDVP